MRIIILFIFLLTANTILPQTVFNPSDKVFVEKLLASSVSMRTKPVGETVVYFARLLKGIPYVGGTLDKGAEERLVVNLRELDCTTYVETVLTLALCTQLGETSFRDYCRHLREIRYAGGNVEYTARKHYFTYWITQNERQGIVSRVEPSQSDLKTGNHLFTAWQDFSKTPVNYMSCHISAYKMLSSNREWLPGIRNMEKSMNGERYRYIPKAALGKSGESKLQRYVRDGDIIAIITSKKGLDTSHIGIAVWHADGLHLLNASQIHKKVVEEPMTLFKYMSRHPTQLGIRICRLNYR
ncbi:MAG: DUF1460 domain-containing protein [Bacteroidales bacterium]|nr:DUF1460 domain-containing protein [Bacteroidales bacterium]MCM1147556.1 DUF1460 domain-containing protein [Bacteroidales bacterium]MCM1206346.1 DUF1460 domain-containing protein [Bacillota bacterium]MCM1511225.1 DUF1460 domain-containing protein [Clostridium sp.]